MIFKRKTHKLPNFPPTVRPTFEKLSEALPVENIEAYRGEVDQELARIEKEAKDNDLINVHLARQIAERCHVLLARYHEFPVKLQAKIVGAIRYFALSHDSFSEKHFASGFDDDAKVMNFVLEELGLDDQFIDLDM
ncbi:MAG: hypothetical protein K1X83_11990 [Oligoflexia bacterium]|nr:hypothetical protein [Oligoflexia bacterium]